STVVTLPWSSSLRPGSSAFIAATSRASCPSTSFFDTIPSAIALVNESRLLTRSWITGCSALSSNQLLLATTPSRSGSSRTLQLLDDLLQGGEPRLQRAAAPVLLHLLDDRRRQELPV